MILLDFGYERAATLREAAALLARLGDDARALAGGTDLLPNMRSELARPGVLVGLSAIEPEAPKLAADGSLRIDALTRLARLAHSALVREKLPMLAESAHAVGSRQIREMGTLGGNLCQETRCLYLNQRHDYQFAAPCFKRGGACCYPFPRNDPQTCWSVHMSDVAPALIALDAEFEILGEGGTRRIKAEELYTGSGLKPLSLGGAELLSAVTVPAQQRTGWGFHKSTIRGGLEFGMAVIAVSLQLAEDRMTCSRARVVVGAVRERPLRVASAEHLLTGTPFDDERMARAAAAAVKEINPLPHHGFTRRHLLDNIKVYLGRTLAQAAERARAGCA
jgi:4-hydroxybenzoyl-CoA reductase beta subunit